MPISLRISSRNFLPTISFIYYHKNDKIASVISWLSPQHVIINRMLLGDKRKQIRFLSQSPRMSSHRASSSSELEIPRRFLCQLYLIYMHFLMITCGALRETYQVAFLSFFMLLQHPFYSQETSSPYVCFFLYIVH